MLYRRHNLRVPNELIRCGKVRGIWWQEQWVQPESDRVTQGQVSKIFVVYGTVQFPRACQPLITPLLPAAYRKMVLPPVNAGLKVNETVSERLPPEPLADEPLPFSTHWLFCRVAPEPAVIGPSQAFPASFSRIRVLELGWYAT